MRRIRPTVAAAAVAALLACAPAAQGATVRAEQSCSTEGNIPCEYVASFSAAAGEANRLTVSVSGATVRFADPAAALVPGPGCAAGADGSVTCTTQAALTGLVIALGDGDDQAKVDGTLSGQGEAGSVAMIDGGSGDDTLTGTDGHDRLIGGPGKDTLTARGGADELFDGGRGSDSGDDAYDGGTGSDTIDYSQRSDDLVVRLGAQGGGGDERDTYTAVENVVAGAGADTVVGNSRRNHLEGGFGDDDLRGEGGDDLLVDGNGADELDGGAGDDQLEGHGGATLTGGSGDDRLISNQPTGRLKVGCGRGRDIVIGTKADVRLPRDCERGGLASNVRFGGREALLAAELGRVRIRGGSLEIPVTCTSTPRLPSDCDGVLTLRVRGRSYTRSVSRDRKGTFYVRFKPGAKALSQARRGKLKAMLAFAPDPDWIANEAEGLAFTTTLDA